MATYQITFTTQEDLKNFQEDSIMDEVLSILTIRNIPDLEFIKIS
jgi:hypothetical protein